MVASTHFLRKLRGRIHRGVHVTPKTLLGVGESRHHVVEGDVPNDQEIDVTRRADRSLRCGPEDEGDLNRRRDQRQRLADDIGGANGLEEQLLQFTEHRRLTIGLKIYLPAVDRPRDETGMGEQPQLALHAALRRARLAHELP